MGPVVDHPTARRRTVLLRAPVPAVLIAVLIGVLGLASCGGSSDDDDGGAAAMTASSEAAAADPSAMDDPFCQQVQAASEEFGLNSAEATDLAEAMSKLPAAAKLLADATSVAPEELRDDLAVLSATLADIGPDMANMAQLSAAAAADPGKADELQAASDSFKTKIASLQDPAFVAAFDNLNTYARDHCGISFS